MEDVVKTEEYFYAVTLDKNGASVTWDAKNSSELSVPSDRLHLRQILLGHTAKVDEYNVIEVEANSIHGTIKIPIAVLKVGELRTVQSNLEFPEGPVTFKLIEGTGPIYIHGQQVPSQYDEDTVDELAAEEFLTDEECLDEEDEDEVEDGNARKKQKISSNNSKNVAANNKTNNSNKKK